MKTNPNFNYNNFIKYLNNYDGVVHHSYLLIYSFNKILENNMS